MGRLNAFFLLVLLTPPASAHVEPGAHHWWTLDPWVWLPMVLFCALYLRGVFLLHGKRTLTPTAVWCFALGTVSLFLALIWPLDALSETSFAAHMAQHMLLIAAAAPLLSVAGISLSVMAALPRAARHVGVRLGKYLRWLLHPPVAFVLHGGMIWFWHAPLLFEWALRWQSVHVLEHLCFLGSAMLFWNGLHRAARTSADGCGAAALWTLATLIHTGFLGALITFAPRLLYPTYAGPGYGFLSPLEDQQLAGLLMWIPSGLCYLVAGLAYAAAWLGGSERHATTGPGGSRRKTGRRETARLPP